MKDVTLIRFPGFERPSSENLKKAGIVPISDRDAGMYQQRKHTYTYNNKLYGGKGYGVELDYETAIDYVLVDDVSNMSWEQLVDVYPDYSY
tara:strand:- start:1554 stop:1826 length:273 start_codon:yes stop_codon:yes gene_type:complete